MHRQSLALFEAAAGLTSLFAFFMVPACGGDARTVAGGGGSGPVVGGAGGEGAASAPAGASGLGPAGGVAAGGVGRGGSAGGSSAGGGSAGAGGDADPRCKVDDDCDDYNPCTEDVCDQQGDCVSTHVADGTPCSDGSPCTTDETCRAGSCVGTARTAEGQTVASNFAFGTELVGGTYDGLAAIDEDGGGLSAFLSDDKLVFADRLDGSGTVLTVARITEGRLVVESQTITAMFLAGGGINGWVFQTQWTTHLLPLSPNRFALADAGAVEVYENDGGSLSLLSRHALSERHRRMDAVATADGQLWMCGYGVQRYRVNDAGAVEELDNIDDGGGGCLRLATPDGRTVYAGLEHGGVVRWAADADPIVPELVVPHVQPLGLWADGEYVAVQDSGTLDMGDIELYRIGTDEALRTAGQTTEEIPYGVGLVAGNYLTAWEERGNDDEVRTQVLRWQAADGSGTEQQLALRRRPSHGAGWLRNGERLRSRGRRLLLQPWRRVLELGDDNSSWAELSGPGHGTIRQIVSQGEGRALAVGTFAEHQLDIDEDSVTFVGGGMLEGAGLRPRLRVVVPSEPCPETGFQGRSLPLQQTGERELVELLVASDHGTSIGNTVVLGGGPAQLITRGESLYQVAPVGSDEFAVREYPLADALLASGSEPLEPALDVTISVATGGFPERRGFAVDVDPHRKRAAILEVRLDEDLDRFRHLVWFGWEGGATEVLGGMEMPDTTQTLALRGERLFVVEKARFSVYGSTEGELELIASEPTEEASHHSVLGLDGTRRVYVSAYADKVEEMLAFDGETALLRSRFMLPDRVISLDSDNERLLAATKASVHLLEASCGDVQPGERAPWPVVRPDDPPPVDNCETLDECLTWEPPVQAGDVNRDGCVDDADAAIAIHCTGQEVDPCRQSILADLDGDGLVNDYSETLSHFGEGCEP